jgi:hypothetical protein
MYSCDPRTLTCVTNTSGSIFQACDATCGNHTPPELQNSLFRGIQINENFVFGEYDLNFSVSTLVARMPDGSFATANVHVNGAMFVTWTSGPNAGQTQAGIVQGASDGPETSSELIALAAPGQPAPTDMHDAMLSANVFVMTRCNSWKSAVCNFSSVFPPSAVARAGRPPLPWPPSRHPRLRRATTADPCNAYLNCTECIAVKTPDLQCGWCLGGSIIYNTSVVPSEYKCAGFQAGHSLPFTCTADFRTEDCAGISCNWTSSQPTCYKSDAGEFPDLPTCEETCQEGQFAKCNLDTKQCDICTEGTPNCTLTKAECDAVCSAPHAKCNISTHQCAPCDPSSDPDCIDTQGSCEEKCQQAASYGICDPLTGQCVPCDPANPEPGCVQQAATVRHR